MLLCAHVTSGALGDSHAASESVNAGSKVTSPAHAHTGALAAHLQRPPQVSLILSKMTFLARFPGLCAVLAACRAAPITATCICLHWSFLSGLSRHKAALKGNSWLLPTPVLPSCTLRKAVLKGCFRSKLIFTAGWFSLDS